MMTAEMDAGIANRDTKGGMHLRSVAQLNA
ncbi:hypothetical protein BH11PSE11_BH11PSE11_34090 [soil metagenome]